MKKIYALAAVACMALTANAQNGAPLYATGEGDFVGGKWAPASPDEFKFENGEYTLQVTNLASFKISTAKSEEAGSWDAFNASAYDCGAEGYGEEVDVARPLFANPDAGNIDCPWTGDYTIKVAGDLSTVTLSTTTPKPDGGLVLYMLGDMNVWSVAEEWKLIPVEGKENMWTVTCTDEMVIQAGEGFKISTDGWTKVNIGVNPEAGIDAVYLEVPTELANYTENGGPSNIILGEEWNGIAWIKLEADPSQASIIFSNDKTFVPEEDWMSGVENITIDNNEAEVYYNLQGVKVAQPESGLYIVVKGGKATKIVK